MQPILDKPLSRKELKEVIKKTPEYLEKFCKNCKWNYFCCQLRVKLSFWDKMRIRLAGHRITKIADHHPKHGWMTKIEKGGLYLFGEKRWKSPLQNLQL